MGGNGGYIKSVNGGTLHWRVNCGYMEGKFFVWISHAKTDQHVLCSHRIVRRLTNFSNIIAICRCTRNVHICSADLKKMTDPRIGYFGTEPERRNRIFLVH